ncbi:U5 small nuclear ribonucleoprotein-specific helicase [Babesia caballi]|uniref:U5 small nuclear ribonucleoprotein 200 kDa helicase n=1 Tax=Babesia caballi TaxID=5871 RepID=A0AAV4LSL1_BABCB|nr:U5 small nuclear ribonucleoprotein-specific helicase [Babesia caballi]
MRLRSMLGRESASKGVPLGGDELEHLADSHARGEAVRVHDEVGDPAVLAEGQVLLALNETHDTLLPVATAVLVTDFGESHLTKHYLVENAVGNRGYAHDAVDVCGLVELVFDVGHLDLASGGLSELLQKSVVLLHALTHADDAVARHLVDRRGGQLGRSTPTDGGSGPVAGVVDLLNLDGHAPEGVASTETALARSLVYHNGVLNLVALVTHDGDNQILAGGKLVEVDELDGLGRHQGPLGVDHEVEDGVAAVQLVVADAADRLLAHGALVGVAGALVVVGKGNEARHDAEHAHGANLEAVLDDDERPAEAAAVGGDVDLALLVVFKDRDEGADLAAATQSDHVADKLLAVLVHPQNNAVEEHGHVALVVERIPSRQRIRGLDAEPVDELDQALYVAVGGHVVHQAQVLHEATALALGGVTRTDEAELRGLQRARLAHLAALFELRVSLGHHAQARNVREARQNLRYAAALDAEALDVPVASGDGGLHAAGDYVSRQVHKAVGNVVAAIRQKVARASGADQLRDLLVGGHPHGFQDDAEGHVVGEAVVAHVQLLVFVHHRGAALGLRSGGGDGGADVLLDVGLDDDAALGELLLHQNHLLDALDDEVAAGVVGALAEARGHLEVVHRAPAALPAGEGADAAAQHHGQPPDLHALRRHALPVVVLHVHVHWGAHEVVVGVDVLARDAAHTHVRWKDAPLVLYVAHRLGVAGHGHVVDLVGLREAHLTLGLHGILVYGGGRRCQTVAGERPTRSERHTPPRRRTSSSEDGGAVRALQAVRVSHGRVAGRRNRNDVQNSNLVLQRDGHGPKASETTGEPESLASRLKYKMGDKVAYSAPKRTSEAKRVQIDATGPVPAKHRRTRLDLKKGESVLSVDITDSGHYVPSSVATRNKYEEILNLLQETLVDQPEEVLKGAFDEVMQHLRSPGLKAEERRKLCEEILGPVGDDLFYRLYHTAKELVDFSTGEQPRESADVTDDPAGIAVVFDEDDEEEEDSYSVEEDDYEQEEQSEAHIQTIRNEEVDLSETEKYYLPISKIDPHWLQRELNVIFGDPHVAVATEKEVLAALGIEDVQQCENKLVLILKYENFEFAKLVLLNRWKIMYCTRLGQAQSAAEKDAIFDEMRQSQEGLDVLQELEDVKMRRSKDQELTRNVTREAANLARESAQREESGLQYVDQEGILPETTEVETSRAGDQPKVVDLESQAFKDGAQHMTNTKVVLPPESERVEHKSYDEVIIHPLEPPKDLQRKSIKHLPEWTHAAFPGVDSLNPVQSVISEIAFEHFEENMLVCAPTGAGKTNVAVLAMLSVMARHRDEAGHLNVQDFKIVYVSPMKSLVMEQAQSFTQRFAPYGLNVRELTGDMSLTRNQLMETQLLVVTPEKWDVVTRRSGMENTVELIIIDEIHLLHDKRGPVLESIVARTLHNDRKGKTRTRLVGLSATMPNYADIAEFLRVNPDRGLFYFGNHYRPVGLEQRYIGIKEKKAVKRYNAMNEIVYERVMEDAGKHQILVFVHSRKETARTAKLIRDMAFKTDALSVFLHSDSASREILATEAEAIKTAELKELLPYGFGIHHAGLPRSDRKLVEDLFSDGHIQLLISTATLSWGVNLPAHTVIIKGTQIYSPEEGCWTELCPLSVQQMMGRAGRPQFDKEGKGIIITVHEKLQFYLSLNNQQLPIESQLVGGLPELLNAEVVLGNVTSLKDAVAWLRDTYYAVRMRKKPRLYGVIAADEDEGDEEDGTAAVDEELFEVRLESLAHTALLELDKYALVRYDRRNWGIKSTALGRIASLYYLKPPSVKTYVDNMRADLSVTDLLRVFSASAEFKYIPVRDEEKVELAALMEKVPIPIRGGGQEGASKVAVLLQSYISRFDLEGYALVSEMTFITQNAGRILRALYEIALINQWSQLAQKLFDFCKMVDRRMWSVMLPLRQFKSLPEELVLKLERNDFGWDRYYDLSSVELGELCRQPKLGKTIHKLIHLVPRLDLQVFVQPLTRDMLRVEVSITPDFQWDPKLHGSNERFWLFVEDGSGETILHSQTFVMFPFTPGHVEDVSLFFTVELSHPLCSHYFLRVISEKWIGSASKISISFSRLILPDKAHPFTELFDQQPRPVSSIVNLPGELVTLSRAFFRRAFGDTCFNSIQTRVFDAIYSSDDSLLLCAPPRSGKFTCAEIAMVRCLCTRENATVVVVCPFKSVASQRLERLKHKFGDICQVSALVGDVKTDLVTLAQSTVVVCTPKQWDFVSRRWKSKQSLQSVDLFVVENLELLDDPTVGPELEVSVSRMRFIAAQLNYATRIVGLGGPVSNALDVGGWLGASPATVFSFKPNSHRVVMPQFTLVSFDQWDSETRRFAMFNSACNAVLAHFTESGSEDRSALVFTVDRRFCRLLAMELLLALEYHNDAAEPANLEECMADETVARLTARERALGKLLEGGVGYCHDGFSEAEIKAMEELFRQGIIKALVVTASAIWSLSVHAPLVVVADISVAATNRPISQGMYPQSDLSRMMSCAYVREDSSDAVPRAVLLFETCRRRHLCKLLEDAFPVESCLESRIEELINAEIVQGAVENAQDAIDWLTWTLYYRRLPKNPNFYSLQGVTAQHLSEHLSELVESALAALEKSQCASLADDVVSPLNLGYIAAFYYLRCRTIETFARSVGPDTGRDAILQLLASADEFADVVVRPGERIGTQKLQEGDVPLKVKELLVAHMGRTPLTNDLQSDQCAVLEKIPALLCALVDVLSSNGWLGPALLAMQLSQRIVQAMDVADSPLKQLPYASAQWISEANEAGVADLFDLMGMEDADRVQLLSGFTAQQAAGIAAVCNAVPVLDVQCALSADKAAPQQPVQLTLSIEREGEMEPVHAPFFPMERFEQWWVVVGEATTKRLLGIKRVSLPKSSNAVRVDFEAPQATGRHELTVYVVSDSYVGTDQQQVLALEVES